MIRLERRKGQRERWELGSDAYGLRPGRTRARSSSSCCSGFLPGRCPLLPACFPTPLLMTDNGEEDMKPQETGETWRIPWKRQNHATVPCRVLKILVCVKLNSASPAPLLLENTVRVITGLEESLYQITEQIQQIY